MMIGIREEVMINWNEVITLAMESFPKMFMAGITATIPLALVSFLFAMIIAVACAMIQYAGIPVIRSSAHQRHQGGSLSRRHGTSHAFADTG